jgi:hypothetical protein
VSVSTEAERIAPDEAIVVHFDSMPADKKAWIFVAQAGAKDGKYVLRMKTGGVASGTLEFRAIKRLGNYEVRAIGPDKQVLARQGFTIAWPTTGPPAVSTDHDRYGINQPVVVSFENLPGEQADWVSIAGSDQPDGKYRQYKRTGSKPEGSIEFKALNKPGIYEVRAFTNKGKELIARHSFEVVAAIVDESGVLQDPAAIRTEADSIEAGAPIVVHFENLTGNARDYVAIAPVGAAGNRYLAYSYVGGAVSGAHTFEGIDKPGEYEARAHFSGGYEIVASHRFTVTPDAATLALIENPPRIVIDKDRFDSREPISVSFENLPGNKKDWVAISTAGSDDTRYSAWTYTNGATEVEHVFQAIAQPGDYEIRVYLRDGYDVLARQAITVVTLTAEEREEAARRAEAERQRRAFEAFEATLAAIPETVEGIAELEALLANPATASLGDAAREALVARGQTFALALLETETAALGTSDQSWNGYLALGDSYRRAQALFRYVDEAARNGFLEQFETQRGALADTAFSEFEDILSASPETRAGLGSLRDLWRATHNRMNDGGGPPAQGLDQFKSALDARAAEIIAALHEAEGAEALNVLGIPIGASRQEIQQVLERNGYVARSNFYQRGRGEDSEEFRVALHEDEAWRLHLQVQSTRGNPARLRDGLAIQFGEPERVEKIIDAYGRGHRLLYEDGDESLTIELRAKTFAYTGDLLPGPVHLIFDLVDVDRAEDAREAAEEMKEECEELMDTPANELSPNDAMMLLNCATGGLFEGLQQ